LYPQKKDVFRILPIGYIRRENNKIFIDVLDEFIPGMKGLEGFSHIQVFWWFDKHDNERNRSILLCNPPYDAPETGVFACRSPRRPNLIALTTAKINEIDDENGLVYIQNIDAVKDSPVIDIKGYFPVCDRVKDFKVPSWASDWDEWFPEEGMSLKE